MPYNPKACSTCATPFVPTSPNSKYCKPCGKEVKRGQGREAEARYRAAHPDKVRALSKAWREDNRDYDLERQARYHELNPARRMYNDARLRARKYGALDDLTFDQLQAYIDQHDGHCELCGVEFEGKGNAPRARTLEHLQPFKDGGENTIGNIALSCWSCNVSHARPDIRAAILRSRQLPLAA